MTVDASHPGEQRVFEILPQFGVVTAENPQEVLWFDSENEARIKAEIKAKETRQRAVVTKVTSAALDLDGEPPRTKFTFVTAFTPEGEIGAEERTELIYFQAALDASRIEPL